MIYISLFINWFIPNFFLFIFDVCTKPFYVLQFFKNYIFYKEKVLKNISISNTDQIAIVVGYEKKKTISIVNLINSLKNSKIKIFYISNIEVDENFNSYLKDSADIFLIRSNFGHDMGAYKYGMKFLFENNIIFSSLYLINDSLLFHKNFKFIIKYISNKKNRFIGLFENFFIHYHVQSFFLRFSFDIAKEIHSNFFNRYRCYNNRKHAINSGEVALTKFLKKKYFSDLLVIYDINYFRKKYYRLCKFSEGQKFFSEYLMVLKNITLKSEGIVQFNYLNKIKDIKFHMTSFLENLEKLSNVHYATLPLLSKLRLIKKDISLRANFPMSYVLSLLETKWSSDREIVNEANLKIREKSNISSMKGNILKYLLFKFGRL